MISVKAVNLGQLSRQPSGVSSNGLEFWRRSIDRTRFCFRFCRLTKKMTMFNFRFISSKTSPKTLLDLFISRFATNCTN